MRKATEQKKPVFVISDLHIGNGAAKDSLKKGGRDVSLQHFLDMVDSSEGQLVICGDLLELWRYRLEDVMESWEPLFDRLACMDVVYVPGNHDSLLDERFEHALEWHPFFRKLSRPFSQMIGSKRFKFMHGHEVDPLIASTVIRLVPAFSLVTGAFEFRRDSCLMTSDIVSDIMLEVGEQCLRFWHAISRKVNRAVNESFHPLSGEGVKRLLQPIRTRNMIHRFLRHQQEESHQVTITGHTHNIGRYEQWYYNCGCWTREIPNYMRIEPDGTVSLWDWVEKVPRPNNAVLNLC